MRSYVVTGGAQGIGRAIAERLARDGHVVVLDRDAAALAWTGGTETEAALGLDPEARDVTAPRDT